MESKNRDYTNGEITVYWQPSKCIHSTICYNRLRSVFDPIKRPWVNMNGAPTEKIIDIVNQCPTDALTFGWNKDIKTQEPEKKEVIIEKETLPPATKIQIMNNGPAVVSGDFVIFDCRGNKLPKVNTVALCRCGHSDSMPYCDGSHNKVGFIEKR